MRPQADANHGRRRPAAHASSGGVTKISHFLDKGRIVVVGRHGAAQGDDEVSFGGIGRVELDEIRLAGEDGNRGHGKSGTTQDRSEIAGQRFDRMVLDDDGLLGHGDFR